MESTATRDAQDSTEQQPCLVDRQLPHSRNSRRNTEEGSPRRQRTKCGEWLHSSFGYLRGYKVVIMMTSFFGYVIECATIYTVGIFYVAWLDEWESSAGVTSSIGSIGYGVKYLTAIPAGYLTDRYGYRPVMIAGGLIATAGIIATAFARSIFVVLVTYAVVTYIGIGLAYIPSITIPTMYFEEGRSFAVGFASAGCGAGQFFMTYVLSAAIERYTWRGAMFILAGITLQCLVLGALMRPPEIFDDITKKRRERDRKCCSGWRSDFAVYKLELVLYILHSVLYTTGLTIIFVHITAATKALTGATDEQAALPLSLLGIALVFGRILSGIIGNLKSVDTFLFYISTVMISGMAAMLLPVIGTYDVIATWSVVFGLLVSPYGSLYQVMLLYFSDLKDLNIVFAHSSIVMAIGATAGAPCAGWLYDVTHDYSWSFYFSGGIFLISGLLLIQPYISVVRSRREGKTDEVI